MSHRCRFPPASMKRKRGAHVGDRPPKRQQELSSQSAPATPPGVEHPVLQRLYPQVLTLRHYLLSRLPPSSKNRRRKLSQLGQPAHARDSAVTRSVDIELAQVLDSALVGVPEETLASSDDDTPQARDKQIDYFTQHLPDCATASTFNAGYFLQAEVSPPLLVAGFQSLV